VEKALIMDLAGREGSDVAGWVLPDFRVADEAECIDWQQLRGIGERRRLSGREPNGPFGQLVTIMIDPDLELAQHEAPAAPLRHP
jgi:hypothetical protein